MFNSINYRSFLIKANQIEDESSVTCSPKLKVGFLKMNFLNHISVRNLSLYFRSNFDVLVKGRGIKDYILTEQLSLYYILISFLKSTACLLFLNIFDRIDCSQVRLAKDYFDVLT